jgi:hypothetical protein
MRKLPLHALVMFAGNLYVSFHTIREQVSKFPTYLPGQRNSVMSKRQHKLLLQHADCI